MKRRVSWAIIAPLLVLGGCRGVLGIEDLDVVADGGTPKAEAGTDAMIGTDAMMGTDARGDALPMPTIDAGCGATSGMACGMCCRQSQALAPGFEKLAQLAKMSGCVCGATGACTATSECGSDLCLAGGTAMAMGCGGCVDMATRKAPGGTLTPACQTAVDNCAADPDCSQVLFCSHSCNP